MPVSRRFLQLIEFTTATASGPPPANARIGWQIRAVLPATLDSVESIFAEFRRRLRYTLPSKARFAAELLLREALTNAVIHGSGANPAMSVHCAIRMRDRKLIIAVADGGPGFDWHSQSGQTADSASCSGRGLEIFRKFATRVRFSARGNLVTLVKDFKEGLTP